MLPPEGLGDDLPDWSILLPELVAEIAGRLQSAEDYAAFRGVCTSWRRRANAPKRKAGLIPLLMLAEKNGTDERELYSISKQKVFRRISLPEAKRKRCVEARFGWLVTVADSGEVSLLNPISRALINLPNFPNFKHHYFYPPTCFIERAMLSANPSDDDSSDFLLAVTANSVVGFFLAPMLLFVFQLLVWVVALSRIASIFPMIVIGVIVPRERVAETWEFLIFKTEAFSVSVSNPLVNYVRLCG